MISALQDPQEGEEPLWSAAFRLQSLPIQEPKEAQAVQT